MNKFRDLLLAFVIGSSILATIITFSYTGNAYRKSGRPKDVPFEWIPIFIPIMFGLMNMLNIFLQSIIKKKSTTSKYIIAATVGALTGLIFSLMGRFGLNLPQKIFNIEKTKEWTVHVIAPIMYAAIFAVIIQPLNNYLITN